MQEIVNERTVPVGSNQDLSWDRLYIYREDRSLSLAVLDGPDRQLLIFRPSENSEWKLLLTSSTENDTLELSFDKLLLFVQVVHRYIPQESVARDFFGFVAPLLTGYQEQLQQRVQAVTDELTFILNYTG